MRVAQCCLLISQRWERVHRCQCINSETGATPDAVLSDHAERQRFDQSRPNHMHKISDSRCRCQWGGVNTREVRRATGEHAKVSSQCDRGFKVRRMRSWWPTTGGGSVL